MISCLTQRPRVEFAPGYTGSLSRAWLNYCLQQAARLSNQPCPWWPADMVIDGLMLWLDEQDWAEPFSSETLEDRLCQALDGVGYAQVAAQFHLPPPPLRIDLLEFAQQADTLLELEFFALLNAKFDTLFERGFDSFCFTQLDECVDLLCPQGRRSNLWNSLRRELGSFLESRLQGARLASAQ